MLLFVGGVILARSLEDAPAAMDMALGTAVIGIAMLSVAMSSMGDRVADSSVLPDTLKAQV